MSVSARVYPVQEVCLPEGETDGYRLCLQWARYQYSDGTMEEGYRFIWRRADNTLQAARGQARIPSLKAARRLIQHAEDQGWGQNIGRGASELEDD